MKIKSENQFISSLEIYQRDYYIGLKNKLLREIERLEFNNKYLKEELMRKEKQILQLDPPLIAFE